MLEQAQWGGCCWRTLPMEVPSDDLKSISVLGVQCRGLTGLWSLHSG